LGIAMIAMLTFSWSAALAQTIYSETFGVPTANTVIGNYTGWSNTSVTYTGDGTCDVRTTSASTTTAYATASGGGNVMINNTAKWFQVAGINTAGKTNLKLSLGIRKGTNAENGSNLVIEISNNGAAYTRFTFESLPTTSSGWFYRTIEGIPASTNLIIKFSNLSSVEFRLDDLLITSGDVPVLSNNNNLATLTVTQGTLSPSFSSAVTSYVVELPNGTTTVPNVQYTLEDAKANAIVTKAEALPGTTTIKVTAENGAVKTYSVAFSIAPPAGTWIETFEGDAKNKTAYGTAASEFVGVACKWNVYGIITDVVDATNQDKKNGARSARLRDPGTSAQTDHHFIEMLEDKANGAGVISLYHGMYGAHTGAASWKLEVSDDGGATWDAFSEEVTSVPTTFTKISFTVNKPGNIRIKITKTNPTSSAASTINIDDIQITNYPPTSIEVANISDLNVYTENGVLYVKNLLAAAKISVYDVTGKLIVQTNATEIPLKSKGIFVVKVNTQAFKVINK